MCFPHAGLLDEIQEDDRLEEPEPGLPALLPTSLPGGALIGR